MIKVFYRFFNTGDVFNFFGLVSLGVLSEIGIRVPIFRKERGFESKQ